MLAPKRKRPVDGGDDAVIDWDAVGNVIVALFTIALFVVLIWAVAGQSEKDRKRKLQIDAERAAKLAEQERQRLALMTDRQRIDYAEGKLRYDRLNDHFGEPVASRIMRGEIWYGQTTEMLVEAIGRWEDFDMKQMATKSRYVYKWGHMGGDRYATRVTVDDGLVTMWERK